MSISSVRFSAIVSWVWAKRQRRLEMLMNGSAGMYGDPQGIAGRSMPELHGLQMPRLAEGMDVEPPSGSEGDGQ